MTTDRILSTPDTLTAPETTPRPNLRTIEDLDREGNIVGKVIFLRGDIDVLSENQDSDPTASIRLKNVESTARRLLDMGAAKVVIGGHVNGPKGVEERYTTKPIADHLQVMLGERVTHISYEDTLDPEKVRGAESRIVLLENLRFFDGEQSKDESVAVPFTRRLAALADTYVSEAFAVSHRDNASVSRLPKELPYAAGPHFIEEIGELSSLVDSPVRPFVAIVGGAKIDTKLPVIASLAVNADVVLVGGKLVREINKRAEEGNPVELPPNVVVAVTTEDGNDIDFPSAQTFAGHIASAKTIAWNGPVGFVEKRHDFGTMMIANAILANPGVHSVLGGGDTVDFLQGRPPGISGYSFVCAGGGAALEFLAGNQLPGVNVLAV